MFARIAFLSLLAASAVAAEPSLTLVRSVTPAVEIVCGTPRLVLIARGPCAGNEAGTRRHVVDPVHCSVRVTAHHQAPSPGRPQWLGWHYIVWADPSGDRVIGSALSARDEMPGPGRTATYELLDLPFADYEFDPATQRFTFTPDLARSPRLSEMEKR